MSKQQIFLLATGSFNPPTIMHFRIMELARDYMVRLGFGVVGGAISPVHDGYGKKDLATAHHRLQMVQLALQSNDWVKLSPWEANNHEGWTRTRYVAEHHQKSLNDFVNGKFDPTSGDNGEWLPNKSALNGSSIQLKLVFGADYLESFNVKGLWDEADTFKLANDYGFIVISREGNDPPKSIYNNDILYENKANIHVVNEWIGNEISSTYVRRALRRSESIRYIVPDPVVDYIKAHTLYQKEVQ